MAVFFNGAFMRELRREGARRFRRDGVEHIPRHLRHHLGSHFGGAGIWDHRRLAGLASRRVMSGRGKMQSLKKPVSQQTGSSHVQYSSSGNQSRSSVGRGRNAQNGPTRGTQPTNRSGARSKSKGTTSSGRTTGTRGNYQYTGRAAHRFDRRTDRKKRATRKKSYTS